MDFMFKHPKGNCYRIQFLETQGLYLSSLKTYSAMVMFGKCIGWCEGNPTHLNYNIPILLGKDWDYKVLANLNCWDLLTILEAEYNRTDELLGLCYPLKNELLESKEEENHQDGSR